MNTMTYQDYILQQLALYSGKSNVTSKTPMYIAISHEQQFLVDIFYEYFEHSLGVECYPLSEKAQSYQNIINAEQVYTSLNREGVMAIEFTPAKDLDKAEKYLLNDIYRLFPEAKKTRTLTLPAT